ANAQLTVQVHCEKDTFLVYEPIPVVVSIRNYSGRTIQLEGSEQKPWLSFVVTDDADSLVRTLGATPAGTAVLIPPGQAVSHAIDLLPLYELRSRGNYRVQAVVANAGASVVSSPVRFSLINGRELWSQVVGLPVTEGAAEEYRNFSLVARRGPTEDSLFVCVKDEPHEVVYSLVPLGGFLPTVEPQARVDGRGRLHVLYQNGPRSFGYAMIDSSAKLVRRAA